MKTRKWKKVIPGRLSVSSDGFKALQSRYTLAVDIFSSSGVWLGRVYDKNDVTGFLGCPTFSEKNVKEMINFQIVEGNNV